jgi:hypothetical protein
LSIGGRQAVAQRNFKREITLSIFTRAVGG